MKSLGLSLAALFVSSYYLSAQLTVEVTQDQDQFLPGEALTVVVRVTNRSGQTLHLGEPGWLSFTIEGRDGVIVAKKGEAPVEEAFTLDSSKRATVRVDLAPADYPNSADVIRVHREVVTRVAALPGVRAAGSVRILPLTATIGNWSILLEGRERKVGENPNGDWQIVTPGYFEALGVRMARGRAITDRDDESGPLVAVINETMAARYWPGEDALGKRYHLGTMDQPWIEIVGVSRDVHHNAVIEHNRAEMYVPHAQWPRAARGSARVGMTLVVKTDGDPMALAPRIRDEIRALDRRVPLTDVRTLEGVASAALAEPRFTTLVLMVFAGLALLLAAVGLYGVVSFVAARRTREIGVRIALGARASQVRWLVVRDGLMTSGAGVITGLVVSLLATGVVASQLYGISRLDPAAFAVAPLVLLVVTALASYLPARRAARLNPVTALRND
jgi:predicted permease